MSSWPATSKLWIGVRLWSVPLAGSAVDLGTFLRLLGGIVKVGGALLGERARENGDVLEEKNA